MTACTSVSRGGLRWAAALVVLLPLAATPAAQPAGVGGWRVVAEGVEHRQWVRLEEPGTGVKGPWNIQALRIDGSRARLDVVRAMDAAVGLETVSSLAQRFGATAAVNGGYFRTTGLLRGDSTGTLVIDGELLSEPDRARAAVGIVRHEDRSQLIFGHVVWTAAVDVEGMRRPLDGINRGRGSDEVVLFTPAFHRTTLTDPTGVEVVVRAGRVTDVRDRQGSTPIPPDGFVLSASGRSRAWATALRRDAPVQIATSLGPADAGGANPWPTAEDVLGAGPRLVTAGRVDVTTAREQMLPAFATDRHPRTAIGTLADGRTVLVIVDGRQPAWSVGMTLDELARLFVELGAVDAINLDGGGSTTMVVEGKVVNRPSDATGERPVSDALIVRPR